MKPYLLLAVAIAALCLSVQPAAAAIDWAYGGIWNYTDAGFPIMVTSGVYYNLTGLVMGSSHNVTLGQNSSLKVAMPGLYKVDFAVSFSGGVSHDYGFGVAKNFDINSARNCYSRRSTQSSSLIGLVGTTCFMQLVKDDEVNIQFDEEAGQDATIKIYTAQLTIFNINETDTAVTANMPISWPYWMLPLGLGMVVAVAANARTPKAKE